MPRTLPWRRISTFGLLSVGDLALTWVLLHLGAATIYESNPIAAAWLHAYGWAGLAFFKGTCVSLVAILALMLALRIPRAAGRVLTFACLAVGAVNLYSVALIGYVEWHASPLVARLRHAASPVSVAPGPTRLSPDEPTWMTGDSRTTALGGDRRGARPRGEATPFQKPRRPAVWLTAWPPQQEFFFKPGSAKTPGLVPGIEKL